MGLEKWFVGKKKGLPSLDLSLNSQKPNKTRKVAQNFTTLRLKETQKKPEWVLLANTGIERAITAFWHVALKSTQLPEP